MKKTVLYLKVSAEVDEDGDDGGQTQDAEDDGDNTPGRAKIGRHFGQFRLLRTACRSRQHRLRGADREARAL